MIQMQLTLYRDKPVVDTMFGRLAIDGADFCRTLEDMPRVDPNPATPENEAKVYGETAIPGGEFRLGLRNSPKFGPDTIVLLNVPGYDYVCVHGGNDKDDTLGCIIVGDQVDNATRKISGGKARGVLAKLKAIVVPAIHTGHPVMFKIINPPGFGQPEGAEA